MISGINKKDHYCSGFNQYSEIEDDIAFIEKNKHLLIRQTNGINIPSAIISIGFKEFAK